MSVQRSCAAMVVCAAGALVLAGCSETGKRPGMSAPPTSTLVVTVECHGKSATITGADGATKQVNYSYWVVEDLEDKIEYRVVAGGLGKASDGSWIGVVQPAGANQANQAMDVQTSEDLSQGAIEFRGGWTFAKARHWNDGGESLGTFTERANWWRTPWRLHLGRGISTGAFGSELGMSSNVDTAEYGGWREVCYSLKGDVRYAVRDESDATKASPLSPGQEARRSASGNDWSVETTKDADANGFLAEARRVHEFQFK